MNIEDYTCLRDAMELLSQANLSPLGELLEQLFDMVVRLGCEICLGRSYGHRVGEKEGIGMVKKRMVCLTRQPL